ncbi:SBBP repeat-containing protein [Brevibacillus nitrificans]|uniref:DUF7948 domain-containing protein n=1 Tax=Brevibacillus nitrificans TaxID=651560 RepID=UPI0026153350|nr:SBBP repeat-containing protein [Brevibacillus nitrificans]
MSSLASNRQEILESSPKQQVNYFVPNVGQREEHILYEWRGAEFGAYFSRDAVMLFLTAKGQSGVRLDLHFLGAERSQEPEGKKLLPGRIHYLKGRDPAQWHVDIPIFQEIVYPQLWPGVDLLFRCANGQIKYEFAIQPGADLSQIRYTYRGAEKLTLAEDGDLLIHTALGTVPDSKPVSFQVKEEQHIEVSSAFVLIQDEEGYTVTFQIGENYDPHTVLFIDPGIYYSTYFGGSDKELETRLKTDSTGNLYLFGTTTSADLPNMQGDLQPGLEGTSDAYVMKLDPTGSHLVYVTYLGGSGTDQGEGIFVDTAGNAYLTGITTSDDFPVTAGAPQMSLQGKQDAYVAKLSGSGSTLIYATYLGGTGSDAGASIAVDAEGNAYVTGSTRSADFPTTEGIAQPLYGGGAGDGFVTKLNAEGTALIYSTFVGGTSGDAGIGIAVDATNHAYITGQTASLDFPTTADAMQPVYGGGATDGFVTKLSPDGSAFLFSTFLGGSENDVGVSIVVDSNGNPYVTGITSSADFPTTANAYQRELAGSNDAFVTRLDPLGRTRVYSTYLGGAGDDQGLSIRIDDFGEAHVAGVTTSMNFPTSSDAYQTEAGGDSDSFVTMVNTVDTPSILSSGDIFVTQTRGLQGAIVTYPAPLITNSCPAGYTVTCDPPSGSFFPVGTTTVTCMLTDPCGGFAESTFNVTVRASEAAPTPTVTPNNLQAECVLVPKVYDWVVLASSYHSKIEIPRECRLLVDAAILAGQQVTFTYLDQPIPAPSCQIIGMRRESIMVGGAFVRVGVVRFLFSAALPIGVFADGIPLCQFSLAVQFEQEVVLCLPEPLGEANILCRTLAVECQSSGNVLLGGMLPVDVQLCAEIQVEQEVRLELLAKFCSPRPNNVPVPSPTPGMLCPMVLFPPQCPAIYPLPSCDCQATANALIPNVSVTLGILQVLAIGTVQIIADICPACEPGSSTFTFNYFDNIVPDLLPGDQSFNFSPTSISSPACITALPGIAIVRGLTVTGSGVRTFVSTGVQETLSYSLTIAETALGVPDAILFTLSTPGGAILFSATVSVVPNEQLLAEDCLRISDIAVTPF